MNDEKIKHLEFIENIILRMNSNSFEIKKWVVVVISALLAVYASTKNYYFVLLPVLPTIVFWFLDAYYLTQERKFRGLYDDIIGITQKEKAIMSFDMNVKPYKGGVYCYFKVLFSVTLVCFYLMLLVSLVGIFVYLKW